MDALNGVTTAVPEWYALLDNLNGQIACRQVELAQLAEYRPPTRSVKNKGSTESLRPKDGENALPIDCAAGDGEVPALEKNGSAFPSPTTPSGSAQDPSPPALVHSSSNPGPQRKTSRRLLTPHSGTKPAVSPSPIGKPQLPTQPRKRRTASVASNNSTEAPKYRTRSMIIVYYDSAVQDAFEELVKRISSSRNAMRKGKMATRMAEMRRMAELEAAQDDEEDEEEDLDKDGSSGVNRGPGSAKTVTTTNGQHSTHVLTAGPVEAEDDEEAYPMPKLHFISTRRMGPTRDGPEASALVQNTGISSAGRASRLSNMPTLRGGFRAATRHMTAPGGSGLPGRGANQNIFDELDAGLEWCQSMCEHAAHQFLRDGECGIEIEGIKRRLGEVKLTAERELAEVAKREDEIAQSKQISQRNGSSANGQRTANENHIEEEDADDESLQKKRASFTRSKESRDSPCRGLKPIHMRKALNSPGTEKDILLADAMEVDDEGIEDMEVPKLSFISSRNRGS